MFSMKLSRLRQTIAAGSCALLLTMAVGAAPAAAYRDSGTRNYSCAGTFGQLSFYQLGSGNSFAPGDYSTYPQWNPESSIYRWLFDSAVFTGGGQWRLATNGNYTSVTPSCSSAG